MTLLFLFLFFAYGQIRYIGVVTWPRGLGEQNKRNNLFIPRPQSVLYCFISQNLRVKLQFNVSKLAYIVTQY